MTATPQVTGIAFLLPHGPEARLLDRVIAFDDGQLVAEARVAGDSIFSEPDGSLMAWHAAELMAQAVSAYSTATRPGGGPPRIGLLLGVRGLRCQLPRFPVGSRLEVRDGVPADRVVVIHNALDVERRRLLSPRDAVRRAWGYTPEDVVVGTAALLKTQKGIPYLIEAARRVAADHPHVHFVHMGSGPLKERIAALIAAAGLQSRFRMLDYVPEPMTLLSGLDMFVLPSLWEGLPIALLESMAAGLPAVGTRVAGIEDVIEHERTGLLVPPADAAALAAAISALATDPQLRARLGRAAGDSLSRFDARTIAAQYRALDAEVVARTRRHSHATS